MIVRRQDSFHWFHHNWLTDYHLLAPTRMHTHARARAHTHTHTLRLGTTRHLDRLLQTTLEESWVS
jgi:hypothetical protein